MYRQLVLLAFVGVAFAAPNNGQRANKRSIDGRIIGGKDADINDFPWQVSLELNSAHICGGSIISDKYIVTAAHCTDGALPEEFTVRANTSTLGSGGTDINVKTINQHPKFNNVTIDYDICILELETSLTFGIGIKALQLPEEGQIIPAGTEVTVTGWGITSLNSTTLSSNLQEMEINVYSFDNCKGLYGRSIYESMMCAGVLSGKKDACAGDSGSPLETENTLWGIVSWGHGCAERGYPGVYTNITTVLSFIKEITGFCTEQRSPAIPLGGRIVGGQDADIKDYPWQVSVEFYRYHTCGGVIISRNYIVTAAHCTDYTLPKRLTVRVNTTMLENGGTDFRFNVTTINQHPRFNEITLDYDISILKLETPLTFGDGVDALKLPEEGQILPAGTAVTVSGWGIIESNATIISPNLRAVDIMSYSPEDCKDLYGRFLTDRMMCAGVLSGEKDACFGDAGGPLKADKTLWGIVSWGIGCAERGNPSVFSNITTLLPFIKEITEL